MQRSKAGLLVLATDLDGTLIPLDGDDRNRRDLGALSTLLEQHAIELVFVTGRHLALVMDAAVQHELPIPKYIICDVGTSIFHRPGPVPEGWPAGGWPADALQQWFSPVVAYHDHQAEIVKELSQPDLERQLGVFPELRKQEAEKQGPFKLSYYCDADGIDELAHAIRSKLTEWNAPYSLIHSVDPFNGDGLIDFLPEGVSKAYALAWWAKHRELELESILFAGDSGNDLAAFQSGYRAIVVGNTEPKVAREAYDAHREAGWHGRLFLARQAATSGVLEGVHWFLPAVTSEQPPQVEQPGLERGLGAQAVGQDCTEFRVWAPACQQVDVVPVEDDQPSSAAFPLRPEGSGYFVGTVAELGPGDRYWYRLRDAHGHSLLRADPVSRFQPMGVHGPSEVVDPNAFAWTDQAWKGVAKRELVIYELHVGTFTGEGTYVAAIERLDELVELGITAIELMPVAQSPGRWNWGYDGVNLFAPRNTYGTPDELRMLVDACHARGLGVILDVVYNHLGPEGNYLRDFGPYFTDRHHTPWGEAFNYDGEHSRPVRDFILENARYWLREFHLDGLRLDAVHFMFDDSQPSILQEIREQTGELARAEGREFHLIAESNIYDAHLLERATEEERYDAIWSECLMHAVYAQTVPGLQLTTRTYSGGVEIAEALHRGFLYRASQAGAERVPETMPQVASAARSSLVTGLQTHDAVGNHPTGLRFHQLTSPAHQRAAAALVLLSPSVPLIFMGEEVGTSSPFPFFVDFEDAALQQAVLQGRMREYPQHEWDGKWLPTDPETFRAAQLADPGPTASATRDWYRGLLQLRKRGIAEGWLGQERLHVEAEPEQGLFRMRYDLPAGGQVVVVARLSPAGAEATSTACAVRPAGTVLMATDKLAENSEGEVLLPAAGAIIWLEE